MNKIIIVIILIASFVIWDKTLKSKEKEVVTAQPQATINISPVEKQKENITVAVVNNKVPSNNCNTPSFHMAKNCDSMYSTYKEKYTLAKDYTGMFQVKPRACTVNGLKYAKESAYYQAEEECDYKIIDSMIDNTIGLACDHIFNQKRNFMFKNEYCRKYIK